MYNQSLYSSSEPSHSIWLMGGAHIGFIGPETATPANVAGEGPDLTFATHYAPNILPKLISTKTDPGGMGG